MNNNPPNPTCDTDLTDVERPFDEQYRKELRSVLADCSEFLAGDALGGYPEAKDLADRCEAMLAQVVAEDHERAAMPQQPIHADEVDLLTVPLHLLPDAVAWAVLDRLNRKAETAI